jgi:hypothetical protein
MTLRHVPHPVRTSGHSVGYPADSGEHSGDHRISARRQASAARLVGVVNMPGCAGTVPGHPPACGRMVIQVQHPAYLGDEVRVGRGLPGLGGLPADPAARRIRRKLSREIEATTPVAARHPASLARLQAKNGRPRSLVRHHVDRWWLPRLIEDSHPPAVAQFDAEMRQLSACVGARRQRGDIRLRA